MTATPLRFLVLASALLPSVVVVSGCGSTNTEIGATSRSGLECEVPGTTDSECACTASKRWACRLGGTVSCHAEFGQYGGGLLVDPPKPYVFRWSECDDHHIYETQCDGLRCQCIVDGTIESSFVTPHAAEQEEASMRCGWPLSRDAHAGTGVVTGAPCLFPGEVDGNCTCSEGGAWSCPAKTGCSIATGWLDPARAPLHVDAEGVFWHGDWSNTAEGTWQRTDNVIAFRTLDSDPSCSEQPGRYALDLASDCSTLRLTLISDPCTARTAFLDGFAGTRSP